jgi:DNA repair exonuclease SbcCD nuclease subunit
MKIAVCSDLHLTFQELKLKNDGAQVLILSGDICEVADLTHPHSKNYKRFNQFFEDVSKEFPQVLYVCGNHEHYGYDFKYTVKDLKEALLQYSNIHVLEKETFVLNDVTFIGATLWTSMNGNDPLTLSHIKSCMNDFRTIKNSNSMVTFKVPIFETDEEGNSDAKIVRYEFKEKPSMFTPEDTVLEHNKTIDFIKAVVDSRPNEKFVFLGHHQPSKKSTHPRYADDVIVNGAYSSNLDEFIMTKPQIKLWTAGHTHHNFDYMIGGTRIFTNPRGYKGWEDQANNFKLKYVEV